MSMCVFLLLPPELWVLTGMKCACPSINLVLLTTYLFTQSLRLWDRRMRIPLFPSYSLELSTLSIAIVLPSPPSYLSQTLTGLQSMFVPPFALTPAKYSVCRSRNHLPSTLSLQDYGYLESCKLLAAPLAQLLAYWSILHKSAVDADRDRVCVSPHIRLIPLKPWCTRNCLPAILDSWTCSYWFQWTAPHSAWTVMDLHSYRQCQNLLKSEDHQLGDYCLSIKLIRLLSGPPPANMLDSAVKSYQEWVSISLQAGHRHIW